MQQKKTENFFLKLVVTAGLILGMLIPAFYVQNLVEERQGRQYEVIEEVSSKWANEQTVSGPFLIIPYSYVELDKDKKPTTITDQLIVLPDSLIGIGEIMPKIKNRSIYKVALYRSELLLKGSFSLADIEPAVGETILWEQAKFCIGVSDIRGIEQQLSASFGQQTLAFEAGLPDNSLSEQGAFAAIDLSGYDINKTVPFNLPLVLKGSEAWNMLPLGKTTQLQIKSSWASPSFTGNFLPEYELSDSGFVANWNVLHFNRNFPQVWKGRSYKTDGFSFGLDLLQPTDNYVQTERTAKYAILFIGLTFGFFFLLEILQGKKVHPVQYLLVGIALVVFYTLLLSIGEVLAFMPAYLIAALATILLITSYSKHLFGSWKHAGIIGGFLAVLYLFIYVLIQLEDNALLVGSIGLFVLLAIAMQLSKKIDWYGARKPIDNNIEPIS